MTNYVDVPLNRTLKHDLPETGPRVWESGYLKLSSKHPVPLKAGITRAYILSKGKCFLNCAERKLSIPIKPESLILLNGTDPFFLVPVPDCELFFAYFNSPESVTHNQANTLLKPYVFSLNHPVAPVAIKVLYEILQQKNQESKTESIHLPIRLLFQIVQQSIQTNKIQESIGSIRTCLLSQEWYPNSFKALLENILKSPEEDWTVNSMARVANMSRSTFFVKFRKATTFTPLELLMCIRMNLACSLLSERKISIKQIAQRAGYETPSAFSHSFKRYTGCSPKCYRERNRPRS